VLGIILDILKMITQNLKC